MTTLRRREKFLRNPSEKGSFPGVACPPKVKPARPGTAGNTVDQNWAKPCRGETVWSIRRVEIGEPKRKFQVRPSIRWGCGWFAGDAFRGKLSWGLRTGGPFIRRVQIHRTDAPRRPTA
jgi:hypothetical protein